MDRVRVGVLIVVSLWKFGAEKLVFSSLADFCGDALLSQLRKPPCHIL